MKVEVEQPIAGLSFQRIEGLRGQYLRLTSSEPLRTLNSSPWGGGFGYHECIVNRQVDKGYHCADPIGEMHDFLRDEGLDPGRTAGMLTAAWVKDVGYHSLQWQEQGERYHEGLQVCTWVTVGLGNMARAGDELRAEALYPGTINSVVLINGKLTDAAMVNAVITVTEAKTAALQHLGVHMEDSDKLATGTTTDAVIIAATDKGGIHSFAGTATQLGYLIGRTVYEAVRISGSIYLNKPY